MRNLVVISLVSIWMAACQPAAKKEVVIEPPQPTTEAAKAIADSLSSHPDTTALSNADVEKAHEQYQKSDEHITDHICDVNFTLLAKPKKSAQVYYVTGFDPSEFKCWSKIAQHGVQVCNEQNCDVYYVDKADVQVNGSLPDNLDLATLKAHGIARFENRKFWTIEGAKRLWKREGRGFDYYDSNNQFGG